MHIPDGYLGPATCASLWGVMLPAWAWASRNVRQSLRARQVPMLAVGAAFCFVLMMFNIPTPGGTTGHAVGSTLIAIILGPGPAIVALSIALTVQALLFGDGGITSLGANCFNMAFVMPMTGIAIYRLFSGGSEASLRRRTWVAGAAAYLSLGAASLTTALELGLQPVLAHLPDGTPLYCPYSWRVTIPVMLGQHLFFFGWLEALVTGLVVQYLGRTESPTPNAAWHPRTALWTGFGLFLLATPLGILAKGSAWGEWASGELAQKLGFVPTGLQRLENLWGAHFSGYTLPGHSGGLYYLISAVMGASAIVFVAWLIGLFLSAPEPQRKSFFEKTLEGSTRFLSAFFLLEEAHGRPGLLQKIDPRLKVITVTLSIILTTLCHSLRGLEFFYALTLVLAILSRLPLVTFLLRTWIFVPLFTLAMVFPILFHGLTPGHVLWNWGFFSISREGAALAALLVLRVATTISWSLLLVLTTRWAKLFAALRVFGIPRSFVLTFQMMVRYLQILVRQLEDYQWAVKSRALSPLTVAQGRQVVTSHMGQLFQRSLYTSEEIYLAMVSRGYTGEPVALSSWWAFGRRDYAWLASWLILIILWKTRLQ